MTSDQRSTVVLLHSLGCDSRMWKTQIAALSPHFRVVCFDWLDQSSEHGGNSVTLAALGSAVLSFLDDLKIARAHICGVSMGGMIAQWIAIHHPKRVERAVFANTAARIGTTAGWQARIEAVRTGGMSGIRDAVLARFFGSAFRAGHPEIAKEFGDNLEAANPEAYIAACAALRDADLRALVSSIRVPSLIIAGGLDESTPPAQAAELRAAITASELVVLEEAAHLSNVEQPEAFNRHLLGFLTGEPAPSLARAGASG